VGQRRGRRSWAGRARKGGLRSGTAWPQEEVGGKKKREKRKEKKRRERKKKEKEKEKKGKGKKEKERKIGKEIRKRFRKLGKIVRKLGGRVFAGFSDFRASA
jgi:hypothetical protein